MYATIRTAIESDISGKHIKEILSETNFDNIDLNECKDLFMKNLFYTDFKDKTKGNLDSKIINEEISLYSKDDLLLNLEKLIDKKIKMNKSYGGALLKQKLINEFINKGYSKEDIISILDSKNLNDNELYNREYEKLYNRYKNKYTGSDLEYFIKQKLYSKGFKKSDL